jgi:hypothetical protein
LFLDSTCHKVKKCDKIPLDMIKYGQKFLATPTYLRLVVANYGREPKSVTRFPVMCHPYDVHVVVEKYVSILVTLTVEMGQLE